MMGKPILEFMTNTFTLREKRGERKDMNLLDKLAFEMSVKEMKKLLPEFKQFCEVAAEQMKIYYDSLIKAGFTPEQSMQLLLYHGINVGRMIGNNGGNSEQTD